jgi:hemerythrin-like domain-containing protein
MCDHCGCREITPIRRLMAEHELLLDLAGLVREAVHAGDRAAAGELFAELTGLLLPHVGAEERGLFTVMRERTEFAEYIDGLEAEHADMAAGLAAPFDADRALDLCERLREHIHAEDYGLFPAALASLGGDDWEAVSAREAVDGRPAPMPATGLPSA